jgi:hypothetical protein
LGQLEYSKVNELLGIDIFSGLPLSNSNNRVALVITDYLSKYSVVIPLPNKKAATVAEAIIDGWVTKFGFPKALQSDQGKEFTSKLSKAFYNLMGIRKLNTTPYTPKANGLVERFNKVIGNTLAKLVCHDQLNWDKMVPIVAMEYNACVQCSTGETPYFMMMGKDWVFPSDITNDNQKWKDYLGDNSTLSAMTDRINAAKLKIRESHLANAERYNQRQRPHHLKKGDQVIFLRVLKTKKNISHKKLGLPGVGPFIVHSVNDLGSRVVILVKGEQREVNAATLVKYTPRPQWMVDPDMPTIEDLTGPTTIPPLITGSDEEDEGVLETGHNMSDVEIARAFDLPEIPDQVELSIGMKVDVDIAKTQRHGILTRRDTGKKTAYVKGKNINRWIPYEKIRPCTCRAGAPVSIPKPQEKRKANPRRTTRIYHRMYNIEEQSEDNTMCNQ